MKLIHFLKTLEQICIDHPDALEMEVIYATDDEANHFSRVHYSPAVAHFDEDNNSALTMGELEGEKLNAILIN